MLNPTTITNLYLKPQLCFKNETTAADKNALSKIETNSGDSFKKQILEQNDKLIAVTSLLTLAAFVKIGIDLFAKNKSNLNNSGNAIYRKFQSLKNDKNIPTIDTCKSINKDLKILLERQIAFIKANKNIISESGNPKSSNRLLLCGPAGVGKSFFAKIFAKSLEAEYKEVLYSDFNSKYVGEHLQNFTDIFKDILYDAEHNPQKKYVVVFNELDTLLNPVQRLSNPNNSATYSFFKTDERSLFLNYLEMLKEKAPNVTIIGTTNISPNNKSLDQAALSRFQNIIEIPYPDKDCIFEALKMNLEYLKNKDDFFVQNEQALKELSQKMADRKCSFRNLEYIVNEAKNIHLEEKIKDKNTDFHVDYLKKAEQTLNFSDGELETTN